jgi:hypothetical protein
MKKMMAVSLVLLFLTACSGLVSDPAAGNGEDFQVAIYALED